MPGGKDDRDKLRRYTPAPGVVLRPVDEDDDHTPVDSNAAIHYRLKRQSDQLQILGQDVKAYMDRDQKEHDDLNAALSKMASAQSDLGEHVGDLRETTAALVAEQRATTKMFDRIANHLDVKAAAETKVATTRATTEIEAKAETKKLWKKVLEKILLIVLAIAAGALGVHLG